MSLFKKKSKKKKIHLMINIEINGHKYKAEEDTTILDACRSNGIYIPTICYHPDLPAAGKCGLCQVKVDGSSYAYACMTKVYEGMSIDTKSPDVIKKAKDALDDFFDISLPPPSKDIEQVYNYLYPKKMIRTREFEKTNSMTFIPEGTKFEPDIPFNNFRWSNLCGFPKYPS